MITLTYEDVIRNGVAAFNEGRLQVQTAPSTPRQRCSYASPCVIGASFDQDVALKLDRTERNAIDSLIRDGHVDIKVTDHQKHRLRELQRFHDNACGRRSGDREMADFRRYLQALAIGIDPALELTR